MLLVPIVFLLLTISLCDATGNVSCQIYTDEEKSLKIFCGQNQPRNCIKEIPLNTSDVIRLKIEGCDQSIVGDASEKFQDIQLLDISHSKYQSLNWTGSVFKNVSDLNASSNELTAIPTSILSKFPKLETIDLSHNDIYRIFNDDFKNANKLMLLNLSYNKLEFVDTKAFDNLNIKSSEINLSHNRFSTFPVAILQAKTIDMLENPFLSIINCTFIEAIRSKHLYFSWKFITVFDGDQNCGQLKFSFQNHEVEGIVPENSNNFWLRYNEQSFKNIKQFVVGPGGYKNFEPMFKILGDESVTKIDLSKNEIVELKKDTFDRFKNLQELNLSETGLKTITFHMINQLENLQHFDISKNQLKVVVAPDVLKWNKQLEYFSAAENQIRNINEILEYLQPTMKQLNLAGNNITDAAKLKVFEQLTGLTHLNLSDTNLTIPNENPFKSLHNLISLDLSHNNLSSANFDSLLSSANQLKEFRVSNGKIKNVSEVIQYVKPLMQVLDLSGNYIGPSINAKLIQTLRYLTNLNLSGTHLQTFDLDAIIPLKELQTLDISHNQLQSINLKALSNFTKLKSLYLNDNDLTNLDNFDWKASPNVSLAISGNQFSCMRLKDLKHEVPNLKYIGNQLDQKHGEDCLSSTQAIGDFLSSVYEKVKFW